MPGIAVDEERRISNDLAPPRHPHDERMVRLCHVSLRKCHAEQPVSVAILRKEHDPAGVSVDPVNRPQTVV